MTTTTRKSPSRRAADAAAGAVTRQRAKKATAVPDGDVVLDLDQLERDGGPRPVFKFVLAGREWFLSDPTEIDWQDVMTMFMDPYDFFRKTLPADDITEFFDTRIPAWKMNILMDRYSEHYGLPKPGEANA